MTGRLKDLTINRDRSFNLTVTVAEDCREMFDQYKDRDLVIDIKPRSRSRSLNANAYAWVLIDKIAGEVGVRKSEVYKSAIRDIPGVSETVIVPEARIEWIKASWEERGLGWQAEEDDSYTAPGFKCLRLYAGSSVYTVNQMRGLIDLLIQDAEALGIPTITPKEQEKLLERWGRKDAEKKPAAG